MVDHVMLPVSQAFLLLHQGEIVLLLELSLLIQLSFRHEPVHGAEAEDVCHDAQGQHGDAQPPIHGPVGIGRVAQIEQVEKGGQQQRLCIARALAVEPEVLLMDEPTSALDPISTSKVEELALELKDRYTIVIVTHNMQQAARISDKTAFFLLGELVEMGDTERLFSTPVDKRTEDYISGRFG